MNLYKIFLNKSYKILYFFEEYKFRILDLLSFLKDLGFYIIILRYSRFR